MHPARFLFVRFNTVFIGFLLLCGILHAQIPSPCDRVRILPAPKHEADLVGGKITGSNVSAKKGFVVLAEITKAPDAGQWLDIKIKNPKVCRWLRYEAPEGNQGWISKLEFYIGGEKLKGSTICALPTSKWLKVVDNSPPAQGSSGDSTSGQFVGLDIGEKGTCARPNPSPGSGDYSTPIKVSLTCKDTEAAIYYTLDGTPPTAQNGLKYSQPVALDHTSVLTAVAIHPNLAPSPASDGVYLFNPSPNRAMCNLGNSLTGNAVHRIAAHFKTGGFLIEPQNFGMGGGTAKQLWNATMLEKPDPKDKEKWQSLFSIKSVTGGVLFTQDEYAVDHAKLAWQKFWPLKAEPQDLTLQPRDPNVVDEVDYEIRWIKFVREKFPQVQPWLYVEWPNPVKQEGNTDKGLVPSYQMKTLYPALSFEEACAAKTLYVEEEQYELAKKYKEGKRAKIIPVALAMGWIRNQIEHGKFPDVATNEYFSFMHGNDRIGHVQEEGSYLIDLVWFAAMYGQSPEGKIWPSHVDLTPAQVKSMQSLAWDVVKNYPDCDLYETGNTPVGKPGFSPAAGASTENKAVTLSSSTPGAWFRYTLDGTEPTRTRGYIYCGVITARPKMTVKAVAYKSGMADSAVSSASY